MILCHLFDKIVYLSKWICNRKAIDDNRRYKGHHVHLNNHITIQVYHTTSKEQAKKNVKSSSC